MAKKHIRCTGCGVLNAGPHYTTPWDDVWLHWSGKPGRRRYSAAPCLQTADVLRQDLQMSRELLVTHPHLDFQSDIDEYEGLLKRLETQPYVIAGGLPRLVDGVMRGQCVAVYTNAPVIDRAEGERMLRYLLEQHHGLRGDHVTFHWVRPRFVIQSM